MRIHAKEVFNQAKGPIETRFSRVINQYDNYINKLIQSIWVWRLVGLLSVVMLVCTIIGWFIIAAEKQKDSVVVIEVNELGRAKFAGRVSSGSYLAGYEIKDYMIQSVIVEYLENTRNIYIDGDVMNRNINKAAHYLSNELKEKLRNELAQDNPFAQIGKIKRTVLIENGIKITQNTWQYDWYDIFTDIQGRELRRIRMKGMFTMAQQEPRTDTERSTNPLGVFIVDYNMVQVNEVLR